MDALDQWLTSITNPDCFTGYGDAAYGSVWFKYIGQHVCSNSLYDTRELALKGDEQARFHMFNYCAALVAKRIA
jgi:hypothetical protein